jgi:predicted RNase H-like nuclease (RuvC/YqgF family)
VNVDPTIAVALITAAGLVVSAVMVYLGVRFTQRSARAAAAATANLDRAKVDSTAYENARETWAESVTELRRQVAELREDRDTNARTVRELRGRVEELETGQSVDRRQIRELADYARRLLRILAEHDLTYPAPPPALDTTT